MYYKGIPEFEFGHGLSYSDWSLNWVDDNENDSEHRAVLDPKNLPLLQLYENSSVTVRISLTNLGPYVGSQTVLVFWRPIRAIDDDDDNVLYLDSNRRNARSGRNSRSRDLLNQKLINFYGTVLLEVGENQRFQINVAWKDLALWDSASDSFSVEPGPYELIIQIDSSTKLIRRLTVMPSSTITERLEDMNGLSHLRH